MQPANLASAPRCGARTRSGAECRSPAVRGKQRCRMHGGNSCGAPKGNRNAWKHGDRSAQTEAEMKLVRVADRTLRMLTKSGKSRKLSRTDW
ncbi:HGGxSTG domain-containing protein [Novosphingobium aerophilum]|uniref:HGGxSTG domain-containing protein n=1 Tax=Novosphingobium aerophilum TaxID=2839843 RepID=UPI003FD5C942